MSSHGVIICVPGERWKNRCSRLESHLRDQIDDLTGRGLSEEEAFLISVKRLGSVNLISEEYSKVNTESLWKHLLLDPADPAAKTVNQRHILLVILFALLAGTVARLPTLFGIEMGSITYFKNLSFYILPFIALFLSLKHGGTMKQRAVIAGIIAATLLIVNLYPRRNHGTPRLNCHPPSHFTLDGDRCCLHGRDRNTSKARMDFLRFTGESVITAACLCWA